MTLIKRRILQLATHLWLRQNTVRRCLFGTYRGLRFDLSGPMFERRAIYFRDYEPEVTQALRQQVQPGQTVYVVGAHVGIHVLYLARLLQPEGQVYAFEGWPENFRWLKRNIALNPELAPSIEPQPICVTDTPGSVAMAQGTSDGRHHIAATAESASTPEMPATSLDAFAAGEAQPPDLILMDIEGHELPALDGSQQIIDAYRPTLIIEHHDQAARIKAFLAARAYRITALGRRHLLAVAA